MRFILFTLIVLTTLVSKSQNVGIGTSSPASRLHVAGADSGSGNLTIIAENPSDTSSSSIKLMTGSSSAYFSRYGGTATGTEFGVSKNHLARILNSGPVLMGGSKLYFGTNDLVRMQIDENGLTAINTPVSPTAQMKIVSNIRDGVYVINQSNGAPIAFGINSRIFNELGSAVAGSAFTNFEPTSSFEAGSYGVIGSAGNTGIGGGFFALGGTALRSNSQTGLAFHSTGKLRLQGIGEADGKVLTTDTAGNASWQVPANPYKVVFVHTASAGNTTGNVTTLTYPDPAATDILFVTANYNPNGTGVYNRSATGVSWTGSAWTIFNQTTTLNIASGAAFNVMVIKQ